MKKNNIVYLLFFLIFSFSQNTFGQKKLKEGKLVFELVKVATEIDELTLLEGSRITLNFTKEQQILDFGLLHKLVNFQVYYENYQDSLWTFYDFMGEKYKIKSSVDLYKEEAKVIEIAYDKTEVKIIAGYPCHKATIITKEEKVNIWVTNKINVINPTFEKLFPGLEGFPLEFYLIGQKANLTYRTTEIASKPNQKAFLIKDEYKFLTESQFKEKMGGMEFGF